MWASRSAFHGIRKTRKATNISSINTGIKVADVRKQTIKLARAIQAQNTISEERLAEYHKSFSALFQASEQIRMQQKIDFQKKIEILAEELKRVSQGGDRFKEGTSFYIQAEFIPADVQVQESIEYYLIKALQEGKTLDQVLPPTLLAQRLTAYSSGSSSSDTSSLC